MSKASPKSAVKLDARKFEAALAKTARGSKKIDTLGDAFVAALEGSTDESGKKIAPSVLRLIANEMVDGLVAEIDAKVASPKKQKIAAKPRAKAPGGKKAATVKAPKLIGAVKTGPKAKKTAKARVGSKSKTTKKPAAAKAKATKPIAATAPAATSELPKSKAPSKPKSTAGAAKPTRKKTVSAKPKAAAAKPKAAAAKKTVAAKPAAGTRRKGPKATKTSKAA